MSSERSDVKDISTTQKVGLRRGDVHTYVYVYIDVLVYILIYVLYAFTCMHIHHT